LGTLLPNPNKERQKGQGQGILLPLAVQLF